MIKNAKLSYLLLGFIAGVSILSTGCSKKQDQTHQTQPSVTDNSSVAVPTAPQQQPQYQQPPQQSTMAVQPNQQPTVNLNKDNATVPTPSAGTVAQIPGQWLRIGVASNIVASVDKPSIEKNQASKQVKAKIKHEYPHADFTIRDTHFNKEYKYKTTVSKVEVDCQTKQFRVTKTEYYDTQNHLIFSKTTKDAKARATGKDNFSSADIQAGLCK